MTHSDTAIRFIRDLSWTEIPVNVQHQAKRCLLDTMGALLAGTATPVAGIMADVARTQFGGNDATILVRGDRVSAAGAVLANGFAQNGLDIDDGCRLVKGHPGACVLPVALTAAEMMPTCTGADFLTALVVGYEIGIRAGLIRHATYAAYHSSGSWGALAGAAAAGRILDLDDTTLRQALGTAEYHAPIAPMMKGIVTPCMGKDSIGWGAMTAMLSVRMAQNGFTGVIPLFDDAPKPEWIGGLGRDWNILNLYFKPYAACRWAQPAVDGALKVKHENGLSVVDIRAIHIHTFAAAAALGTRPPSNTEEAQYNIAYPVAAALIDGEVGPSQVLPPRIFDSDVRDLLGRVATEIEPDHEAAFPGKTYAEVVIATATGERLSSGRMEPRWEPPGTLPSDAELEGKFDKLAAPILGEARARELRKCIWRFEETERAAELVGLCRRSPVDGSDANA
ncbi:MAG: MmgE/PrpD family protein [Deltaproteobacteria bacterium]|nr:MmgE/PrpD family protein [Deltaproteobacteria bacterium]